MELDKDRKGTGRAFERERKPLFCSVYKNPKVLDMDRQAKIGNEELTWIGSSWSVFVLYFSVLFGVCPCGSVLFVHNGVLQTI